MRRPWSRRRLLEDLGFQRFLAEQSLQLANRLCKARFIRYRHDLFAAGGRQRPLGHQPAPREELVRGNAMSATHHALRDSKKTRISEQIKARYGRHDPTLKVENALD